MNGEKILQIMRSAGKTPAGETTDLLFGIVTSVNPLKIKVDNRFEVDQRFILLSAMAKEMKITVDEQTITLWRNLSIGDKVRLLRFNRGQMFYVLEREV